MFVGEIGITRREFLYEIEFWEARRILKGYSKRGRDLWSGLRWHAYNIMSAIPYCDLKKAGIRSPLDLIKFPWDGDGARDDLPSDEEVDEIRRQLIAENERRNAID